MTTLPEFFLFIADACLIGVMAWMGLCAFGPSRKGIVEATLGWLVLGLAWIVFSGVCLGLFGGLGRSGFFFFHLTGLTGLLIGRRKWREAGEQWFVWCADWKRLLRSGTPEGWIVIALIMVLVFLTVLSVQAEPAIFDALTYRLSRIGQWLQDGRIANYRTDDPRLDYMPVGPDLIIAWLLGATNTGFWLAPLSQLIGGGLLLGATFGLARVAKLSRLAAFGAVALVLGMANVAVQFTTIQSDLFTAGIFAASYLLWHRAWMRSEGSWVAGIGVGLAWGSKGTLFYLAPGAALWVIWLVCQRGWSWKVMRPTAAGAALALLVFVGPSYYRNLSDYGSLFGPHEAMVLHHGGPLTPAQHVEKLEMNLGTSAVQLFDPTAQPFWCQDFLCTLGRKLLPSLNFQDDRYLFSHGASRRLLAGSILHQPTPDADVLSCGILAVVIFSLGVLMAVARRAGDPTAPQVLIWSAGVGVYILVQHALVQWHPWAFRFIVLAAPWLGVVGAWGVCQLARRVQLAVWAVIVVSTLQVFFVVQWRTYQAAWQVVSGPDSSLTTIVYRQWRTWADQLDRPKEPLRLALPLNYAQGAFYRMPHPRWITLERFSDLKAETAETATSRDGGWLVVPAFMFKGREGHVMSKIFLFNEDENNAFSLAAYRTLQPGEFPPPVLYHRSDSLLKGGIRRHLLIRSWQPKVSIWLKNPAVFIWKFEIATEHGRKQGELQAGEEIELEMPISDRTPEEVTLDFQASPSPEVPVVYPATTLAKP